MSDSMLSVSVENLLTELRRIVKECEHLIHGLEAKVEFYQKDREGIQELTQEKNKVHDLLLEREQVIRLLRQCDRAFTFLGPCPNESEDDYPEQSYVWRKVKEYLRKTSE